MKVGILISLVFLFNQVAGANPQDDAVARYRQIVEQSPETTDVLSRSQLQQLFDHVVNHPVASLAAIGNYDHQPTGIGNGEIGFCFGRAMAAHLAARTMGLRRDSIRKIFIAGDLHDGGTRWRFHVTTVAKGDDGVWYAIDPLLPSLGRSSFVPAGEWMDLTKHEFDLGDGRDESKFYFADPRAVMVDMTQIPANVEIENALRPLIGERLIDVTFTPDAARGFSTVPRSEISANYDLFLPTADAQNRYFINIKEPVFNGRPVFDFDFFRLSTVIFYQPVPQDPRIVALTRTYDYNGYFPALLANP